MTQPLNSPDGRRVVRFNAFEMRMSHWVEAPVVIDADGGGVLFALDETLWSADWAEWSADSRRVTFALRRYPGDAPGVTLEADLDANLARIRTPREQASLPLAAAAAWLEDWYARQKK